MIVDYKDRNLSVCLNSDTCNPDTDISATDHLTPGLFTTNFDKDKGGSGGGGNGKNDENKKKEEFILIYLHKLLTKRFFCK